MIASVSAAAVLRDVAAALRRADRAVEFVADVCGLPHRPVAHFGTEVEVIAAWLDAHPDVDRMIGGLLELGRARP